MRRRQRAQTDYGWERCAATLPVGETGVAEGKTDRPPLLAARAEPLANSPGQSGAEVGPMGRIRVLAAEA